ncbi:hypothetical protein NW762_008742 [Fusarium torreyae]|uniref:Uncharacterized protein n=1 Tax=Fusarium torreyae TaxID=1237075 RepID=A0A9W8RXN2_9HYPO|nr:hypothetical protein NW762_008742 [Fusarium torreyae]
MGGNFVSTLRSPCRKRPLPDEFGINLQPNKWRRLRYIKDDCEVPTSLNEDENSVEAQHGNANSAEPGVQKAIELLDLLTLEQGDNEPDNESGYESGDELSGNETTTENERESNDESEAKDDTGEDEPQDKRVVLLKMIVNIHTNTESNVGNSESLVQGTDPILQQVIDEALAETSPLVGVDCSTLRKAVRKAIDEEREDALCRYFESAITMPSSAAMDLDEQDGAQLRHK